MENAPLYDANNNRGRIGAIGLVRRWVSHGRLRAIAGAVELRGAHLLEVGCDHGTLLRMLEGAGASACGIEVNEDAVRRAAHPRIRVGSAEAIDFPDGSFDVCVASHVIEHLPEPQRFFAEAARVLIPGGKLALVYPWELFRGMSVIPEVLIKGEPLSMIYEYHRHRFTPSLCARLARELPLVPIRSSLFWGFPDTPQYLTVLERV
jgi:SAM-dependent methyltransferase